MCTALAADVRRASALQGLSEPKVIWQALPTRLAAHRCFDLPPEHMAQRVPSATARRTTRSGAVRSPVIHPRSQTLTLFAPWCCYREWPTALLCTHPELVRMHSNMELVLLCRVRCLLI